MGALQNYIKMLKEKRFQNKLAEEISKQNAQILNKARAEHRQQKIKDELNYEVRKFLAE